MKKTWNDAEYAILKEMWEDGYRREAIAEKIGVTPNAVSGMVHRKGYERIRTVAMRDASEKVEVPAVVIEAVKPVPKIIPVETKKAPPPEKPIKLVPIVSPPKVRSIETRRWITKSTTPGVPSVESPSAKEWIYRSPRECAFPVGQADRPARQDCCGNPTAPGKSYCSGHLEIMFPAKIQKRAR